MARMNWRRAGQHGKRTERNNDPPPIADALSRRAAREMRHWMKRLPPHLRRGL